MIRTFLENLNIIPVRNLERRTSYEPKSEQHPQSVAIGNTVTPDGQSMDNWMNGGWNQFHWPLQLN